MPAITERVYPDETDPSDEFQAQVVRIFAKRYELARDWLEGRFEKNNVDIVDIACGSGYGSATLEELGEVRGVDIDVDVVRYAEKTYGSPRVRFVAGDATDEAFLRGLGKVDAVVSCATIEHLDHPEQFLEWIRGALRPGGVCVLCFPAGITRDWAGAHHRQDISRREAARLLENCGFEIRASYFQSERIKVRHLLREIHSNQQLAVPKIGHWFRYYLVHPHHLMFRLYELMVHRGFLMSDQMYLLSPKGGFQS